MASKTDFVIVGLVGILIGMAVAGALFALVQPSISLQSPISTNEFEQAPLPQLIPNSDLNPLPSDTYTATIGIVAVQQQTNEGMANTADVEIRPGKGRVLMALNPFVEPDTQQSAETAASVAARITQKDLSEFDLIYSIDSPAKLVGGPSAGAALAVATVAAIEQRPVRKDAAITGTVLADGRVGAVGGVLEKATAASKAGKKLFLIPKGQSRLVYYEPKVMVEQRGPFRVERRTFVPRELDLIAYARDELELEIREVQTVSEAVKELLE